MSNITKFFVLFIIIFFISCKSSKEDNKDKNINIDLNDSILHILGYAKGKTKIEPSLEKYIDANITEVNSYNLKQINKYLLKHNNIYNLGYNPQSDYIYNLENSNVSIKKLKLHNNKITLTSPIEENTNASFLKINVKSKLLGKYFFTHIYINHKNKIYKFTFEPNARGIRYLNITHIPIHKNDILTLLSRDLNITSNNVELIQFKQNNLSNKKILILSPHPDDAELAAFGIYNKFPKNTYIITITSGDAGSLNIYKSSYNKIDEKILYRDKGTLRVLDSLTVPRFAGVSHKNILNLGFYDGTLKKLYENNTTIIKSSSSQIDKLDYYRKLNTSPLSKLLTGDSKWVNLIDNLSKLVKVIKPDIIITPYPLIDRHPDHQMTTTAIIEVIKKLDIHTGKLYLYSNHYFATSLHPFGSKGDIVSLPPTSNVNIYFNSIYSNYLDNKAIGRKIIALNAMSDLRLPFKDNFFKNYNGKDKKPISYTVLNQNARRNELFFIVDIKNIYDNNIISRLYFGDKKINLQKAISKIKNSSPIIEDLFNIYQEDNLLFFVKENCKKDYKINDFRLHIYPKIDYNQKKYNNIHQPLIIKDFRFRDYGVYQNNRCIAAIKLPKIKIKKIITGQYDKNKVIWKRELNFDKNNSNLITDLNISKITKGDINYNIEKLKVLQNSIKISGWAYKKNQNHKNYSCIILLKNNTSKKEYFIQTDAQPRYDVVDTFNNENYLFSGFSTKIKTNILQPGNYNIGIIIINLDNMKINTIDTKRTVKIDENK